MNKKVKKPGALVKAIPSPQWKEREDYKKANRSWLKKSVDVALRVLDVLDKKKMSQSELAEKLKVSRQQVSKILKGQENLTLETIAKLESVLGIELVKVSSVTKVARISLSLSQSKAKRKGVLVK